MSYTTDSNILTKSALSVEEADSLLAGHGKLDGLGQVFLDVEGSHGINACFGMAQAIEETGWGTSAIAEDKNNLFGFTAYDSNPYGDAASYPNPTASVLAWADFIKAQYLTPGGAYYVSPTPAGVARHWATDPNYASNIVAIMNELSAAAGVGPPSEPVSPPEGGAYTVKEGDNMSAIARNEGVSLAQLESANPSAGHPAGNYNDIWPGDSLVIPGKETSPPQNDQVYVTVPPAPEGDLSSLSAAYGSSVQEIVGWNKAKYPSITPDYVQAGWYIRVK